MCWKGESMAPFLKEGSDLYLSALAELAPFLRETRLAMALTQEEVAYAAGLAVPAYGRLERGRSPAGGPANPTLHTMLRVFGALDLQLRSWAEIAAPTRQGHL